jgi:phenylacetate-coenzyme A ligase PaaK-like adenylate-forming protein
VASRPLNEWNPDLAQRAVTVASRAGHRQPPGVGFAEFWSALPVTDAPAPALPVGLGDVGRGARILFSSGGSTGTPKFTSLTMDEVLHNCHVHGRSYLSAGVGADDVVAVWGMPGLMSSEFTVYLALAQAGCCILPIGIADPAEIARQVALLRATVLLVMPSDLLPVAQFLERAGSRLSSVHLVLTGGEALYPADEARYRELFDPQVRFRSTFQTSEVGAIGYQCDACGFGEYHVHDDLQLAEVVEINAEGIGELVTTNLHRRCSPVLRQRTGDRVSIIDVPCACGNAQARIRLHGRTGKFVNFGGEKFDVNLLLNLKPELGLRSDDFVVALNRDDDGRDRFVLHSQRVQRDAELRERVSAYFRRLSPKVSAQLTAGSVADIAFADLTGVELTVTVAGKAKHFIDQREPARPSDQQR